MGSAVADDTITSDTAATAGALPPSGSVNLVPNADFELPGKEDGEIASGWISELNPLSKDKAEVVDSPDGKVLRMEFESWELLPGSEAGPSISPDASVKSTALILSPRLGDQYELQVLAKIDPAFTTADVECVAFIEFVVDYTDDSSGRLLASGVIRSSEWTTISANQPLEPGKHPRSVHVSTGCRWLNHSGFQTRIPALTVSFRSPSIVRVTEPSVDAHAIVAGRLGSELGQSSSSIIGLVEATIAAALPKLDTVVEDRLTALIPQMVNAITKHVQDTSLGSLKLEAEGLLKSLRTSSTGTDGWVAVMLLLILASIAGIGIYSARQGQSVTDRLAAQDSQLAAQKATIQTELQTQSHLVQSQIQAQNQQSDDSRKVTRDLTFQVISIGKDFKAKDAADRTRRAQDVARQARAEQEIHALEKAVKDMQAPPKH